MNEQGLESVHKVKLLMVMLMCQYDCLGISNNCHQYLTLCIGGEEGQRHRGSHHQHGGCHGRCLLSPAEQLRSSDKNIRQKGDIFNIKR